MPYKNPETQRQYQLAWVKKNRADWIENQGSTCALCGATNTSFEVDHIDPSTKVSHRIWSWSKKRRDDELKKCQLLCTDCHWTKTGEENTTGRQHGTSMYHDGCRCEICIQVTNNKKRLRRAERKAAGLPVT